MGGVCAPGSTRQDTDFHAARSRVPCAPEKPVLFDSGASIVGNTILKGHMHRYEWSRDIDSGTAATRKSPSVNEDTFESWQAGSTS